MDTPNRQDDDPDWASRATALVPDVISVLHDHRFVWVAPSITALLGYAPAELIGRTPADFVHPDDGAIRPEEVPAAAGEAATGRQVRARHKDGSYRWVQSRMVRQPTTDDSPGSIVMSTRDVDDQVRAQQQARDVQATLRAALDANPDGFAVYRVQRVHDLPVRFTLVDVNAAGAAMYHGDGDPIGREVRELFPEAEQGGVLDLLHRAVGAAGPRRARITIGTGSWRGTLDVVTVPVDTDRVLVTWRDVTDQVLAEQVIVEAYERAQSAWDALHAALDATPDAVLLVEVDPEDRSGPGGRPLVVVEHANQAAAEPFGGRPDELLGLDIAQVLPTTPDDRHRRTVLKVVATGFPRTLRFTTGPGSDQAPDTEYEASVAAVGPGRAVLVARDVTAHVTATRRSDDLRLAAERAADHDPLTGLPNRTQLERRLRQALMSCDADHRVGVVFCDLDGFKQVNDRYGHRAGDRLLREVARRLRTAVDGDQLAARLAGDEFVLVLPGLAPRWDVDRLLTRIRTEVTRPVDLGTGTVVPAVSLGHHLADPARERTDREPLDVLAAADRRMYLAKPGGAGN